MYRAGSQPFFEPEESAAAAYMPYQAPFGILPAGVVVKPVPVSYRYPQVSNDSFYIRRGDERLVFGAADAAPPARHDLRLFLELPFFTH
jgi:hypothetical protein